MEVSESNLLKQIILTTHKIFPHGHCKIFIRQSKAKKSLDMFINVPAIEELGKIRSYDSQYTNFSTIYINYFLWESLRLYSSLL